MKTTTVYNTTNTPVYLSKQDKMVEPRGSVRVFADSEVESFTSKGLLVEQETNEPLTVPDVVPEDEGWDTGSKGGVKKSPKK